jgi:predicted nuclease with TOPRIM domain
MAKVFGILTAIVLALSALFAYKNKAAYENVITETQTRKAELTRSDARLKAAEEVLKALPVERAGVDAEVATLTTAEAAEQKGIETLKSKVDTATAKIASNKEKLDDIREKTSKTGDLKELASKMRATNAELEELGQSITAGEAKLANLTAQNSATDAQVADSKGKFENFAKGVSLPELKTRIRSIYPNWGFVTLASGNNAGVVPNSTLDVVRDGATIGKLLVTAVESNSSSASIVPDSLGPDVTLAVGDRVMPSQKADKPTSN